MRKLLVFQHAATEPLGVLDPMLRRPAPAEDRLLRHFDGSQPVFQWHAYTFDLPRGALPLASEKVFGDFIELFSWRPKKKIRLESR